MRAFSFSATSACIIRNDVAENGGLNFDPFGEAIFVRHLCLIGKGQFDARFLHRPIGFSEDVVHPPESGVRGALIQNFLQFNGGYPRFEGGLDESRNRSRRADGGDDGKKYRILLAGIERRTAVFDGGHPRFNRFKGWIGVRGFNGGSHAGKASGNDGGTGNDGVTTGE